MSHPAISIILPVCNGEKYLGKAIESVLANTFADFELLVIDDGSTDGSGRIARRYQQHNKRVEVIFQNHSGLVAALNTGLEASRADIIARMDADDICMPERLRFQFDFLLNRSEISCVSCLVEALSAKPVSQGIKRYMHWLNTCITPQQIEEGLYIESPIAHPSAMFRKSAVIKAGMYRKYDGPEDYDLWLRMAAQGMQFAKVEQPLLQWRFHSANLTKKDSRYRKNAFFSRKLDFIVEMIAKGRLGEGKEFRICGPGQEGRKLHRALADAGFAVNAFIDVNTKRATNVCQKIPVLAPDDVGKADDEYFYLCAVRRWDSWEQLHALFGARNKIAGRDYLLL